MGKAIAIRLRDITKLDQLELQKRLAKDELKFETDSDDPDQHNELVTATAVVLVSLAALRVLAIYLLRKTNQKRFKKQVEIITPDGKRHITTIEYSGDSREPPEAEVLKQLAAACEVDLNSLPKV